MLQVVKAFGIFVCSHSGAPIVYRCRGDATLEEAELRAAGVVECELALCGGVPLSQKTVPAPAEASLGEMLKLCSEKAQRIRAIAAFNRDRLQADNERRQGIASGTGAFGISNAARIAEAPQARCGLVESAPASSPCLFSELEDDEELVRDFFAGIDTGGCEAVSLDALRAELQKIQDEGQAYYAEALEASLAGRAEVDKSSVTFEELFHAFRELPRAKGERVHWAATLGLESELARLLKRGSLFDGLRGLRDLEGEELEGHIEEVCARFAAALPTVLRRGLERLKASINHSLAVREHINTKFVMDDAYVGKFATLNDFYNGPEALIGVPNPKIYEGAEKEHCLRSNATVPFTTSNYNVTTHPRLEWELVVCPREGIPYPHTPRDRSQWAVGNDWKGEQDRDIVPLDELLERAGVKAEVERAGLLREEVICLRLYTGPMFVLYNTALRGLPPHHVRCLLDNRYETTIFVIASGVTKLAKVTGVPANRLLYRGLGGELVLPDQFWRSFEECQVALAVRTGGAPQAQLALGALEARVGLSKAQVMISRHKVECRVLRLPPNGRPAGRDPSGADLPAEVRVVSEGRAEGGTVRLAVALLMSTFDFGHGLQARFREAVRLCCGPGALDVSIEEVAHKPRDFKGGVEFGLLSTTSSKATALGYSGARRQRGMIFEIQAGRVDVGESIQFLSQYPGEDEYLMQPLSCLEVTGEPRLDSSGDGGEVIAIPLRVNVNLKAVTVEDLIRRRKALQLAMAKNLGEDLLLIAGAQAEALQAVLARRRAGAVELIRGRADQVALGEDSTARFAAAAGP